MKKITAYLLIAIMLISLFSCTDQAKNKNSEISIVATLFPQYDFAKAILGDKGTVKLLLTPGTDSHSFEITPSDMKMINNCDIFIYTGPDMEIWVEGIISSINENVNILEMSYAAHSENAPQYDEHTHKDPHIWTSPVIAQRMLRMIFDAICGIDPDNYEYYYTNYSAYNDEIEKLNNEFKEITENAENKTLYFSGKFAFYHFVSEYGLEYYAPFNSCSDVQIESIASVKEVIAKMKTNNVKYVFYEELANNSITETIVKETGATALLLHSAHNVSKAEFEGNASYISIMKANAENLRKALSDGKTS